jgi:hypothetical protein
LLDFEPNVSRKLHKHRELWTLEDKRLLYSTPTAA